MIVDLTKEELQAVLLHHIEHRGCLRAQGLKSEPLNRRISHLQQLVNRAAQPESYYSSDNWSTILPGTVES